MWVVANGAPKTGSTWPVQLLVATRRFEKVPADLQNPAWNNSSIRDDLVRSGARLLAASSIRYLSKQHWLQHKRLLGVPGLKILNSIRDIRDTFVSRYYHEARLSSSVNSISDYLHRSGNDVVSEFCAYQKYWIKAAERHAGSYYILSYERLSKDYENAARDLFRFCDVQLTEDEFDRAVDYASFAKRDSGPGRFFRKGQVHAFSDDLSEEDVRFLMKLSSYHGLREIKKRLAAFDPDLKPFLEMTDVGL